MTRRSIAAVILTSIGSSATAQQPNDWIIPKDRFDCIVSNLSAYKAQSSDPILIFVTECPITDVAEVMAKRTYNNLPAITGNPAAKGWDEAIVFSRSELDCIANKFSEIADGLVVIPKKPCG